MGTIQFFKNEIFEVAATIEEGQILFDAEKIAICLGFTQTKNNREYVRWETINRYLEKYLSQEVGKGSLIPEPFVYKLAFKASNEVAEKFQDWLAIDVIPSIRKNGGYLHVNDGDSESTIMAKALLLANQKIEQQKSKLDQQQPKVLFADSVAASSSSILVRELAKLISQNGVKIGEKGLFQWLRENGYLIKKLGSDYNTPTQRAVNLGLFEVKETAINKAHGIQIARTSKVTGKGQIYFINKFLELAKQEA